MATAKTVYLDDKTWKRLEQIQRRYERTISISNLIEVMIMEWFANYDLKINRIIKEAKEKEGK